MRIITAFPGIKISVVYPCHFSPFLDLFFFYEIDHHIFGDIEFVSIWWPRLVVFRLHGNGAGVSGLLISDFLWFFFTPPTDPKPGNLFEAERIKRGLPKPYGFFLGFLTTLLLGISVYLSFVLFCSFFVGEINWNWNCSKTLYIPFGDSQARIIKWKARGFIYRKGNGVGLGLVIALRFTRALSNGPEKQDYWMVDKHVNKKNAGKPHFLINTLLHSLVALTATFSAVDFYCYL